MNNETTDIFSNVAPKKVLPIYDDKGATDPKKVADLLDYDNQDVAKISGISTNSVRYEAGRIPQSVVDRFREIANICELVAEHFSGDVERTVLWFKMKNPLLGNISPRDMIRFGRYKKLVQILMDFKQGHIA